MTLTAPELASVGGVAGNLHAINEAIPHPV